MLLGLSLGSFATALIYRIPRELNWAGLGENRRSNCPSCRHKLHSLDLLPVISWLVLGGRCRYCDTKISALYPLTELATTLCVLLTVWLWGLGIESLFFILAIPFLMALLVIDLKHLILPNVLVLIIGILGGLRLISGAVLTGEYSALWIYALSGLVYGVFAWALGLICSYALKKEALGMGDVKFFIVSGLWLGPMMFPFFILLAGTLGVGLGLIWQGLKKGAVFPFGPALIISFFIMVLYKGPLP